MELDKRKARILTAILIITIVLTVFVYRNNSLREYLISVFPLYEKPWAVALSCTVVGALIVLLIDWVLTKLKK